jgi:hypothetical protein
MVRHTRHSSRRLRQTAPWPLGPCRAAGARPSMSIATQRSTIFPSAIRNMVMTVAPGVHGDEGVLGGGDEDRGPYEGRASSHFDGSGEPSSFGSTAQPARSPVGNPRWAARWGHVRPSGGADWDRHSHADRAGRPPAAADERSTTAMGSWYATVLFWKPQVALFVNETTLLPLLMPFAPAVTVLARFPRRPRTRPRRPGHRPALHPRRTHRHGQAAPGQGPPTAACSGP